MENYVSVEIACLRFLDSYRFLSSSWDNLVKSLDTLPMMDSNNFKDEIIKRKLASPCEYFNLPIKNFVVSCAHYAKVAR